MTSTCSAAATGLPTVGHPYVFPRFAMAAPIPGLATRPRHAIDAAEQARAMNAVLADLNAILAISATCASETVGEGVPSPSSWPRPGAESVHLMDTLGGANV